MSNGKAEDRKMSDARRSVLKGAAAGLAGLVATSSRAESRAAGQNIAAPPISDYRNLYPKGPFPEQPQNWPGLAGKMTPRPDHGEETYRGSGKMAGRKCLITGGDSGIGRAVAIAFAREGADVVINYLPQEEEDAREVIALIKKEGRKAIALPGDLRDESFCKKLVNDAARQLDGLDTLVNVAGRQKFYKDIVEMTTEDFDWTMKTNVYALFWLVRAAVPLLPKGGVIINTASTNAYEPMEILIDYSMTKAAIANMTKSLAKQLGPRAIRVNAVAPGPFWTALQTSGGQPKEKYMPMGQDTVIGRVGQPVEIASTYVTLASSEASYLTGQVWGITGGNGLPG